MTSEINDKNAENTEGLTREDYFDINSDTIAIYKFYNERRKQAICEYIEKGGAIIKECDTLLPQISYHQLENTRHKIDKFYDDKLDFIEYGSSSVTTTHCMYRHSDNIVYIVIIKPQHKHIIEMKYDNTATDIILTQDKHKHDYIGIIKIFPASKMFIKKSFYFKPPYNGKKNILYYPGCWSIMNDDTQEEFDRIQTIKKNV